MSRTYRIRHLPRFTAKKYTDGRAGISWRRRYERVDRIIEEKYPELKIDATIGNFGVRWQLRDCIERGHPLEAEQFINHPWVDWCRVARMKHWHKKDGNRATRRWVRVHMKEMNLDETYDDEVRLPKNQRDVWDIWNLY